MTQIKGVESSDSYAGIHLVVHGPLSALDFVQLSPVTKGHNLQAVGIPHALRLSQFSPHFLLTAKCAVLSFVLIHGQEFSRLPT
jgi:hypothetical protein